MEKFNPYVILLETQPWMNWSPTFMYMETYAKKIQKESQKKVITEKMKSSENAFV